MKSLVSAVDVYILHFMKNINSFLTAFNFDLKRASRLADSLESLAEGFHNAVASGAEVIDLRVKPNAQPSYALTAEAAARILASGERLPRRVSPKSFDEADLRMSKVPGVPTAITGADVRNVLASVLALKAQARVVDFMARKRDPRALDVAQTVLVHMDVAVAALENLDPSLTEYAVRESEKQHIENFDEAADLDVTGFHQTDSDKGDATTMRYDETRELRSNNKADLVHAGIVHTIDEDAMLAELADLTSED